MTSGGVLEHARAVALSLTGVGTAYLGPFRGSNAAAQIALGASGTTGAQVAHTMVYASSASAHRGGPVCAQRGVVCAHRAGGGGLCGTRRAYTTNKI